MATVVTRSGKGSALTWAELDANFNNLNAGANYAISAGSSASCTGNAASATQLSSTQQSNVITGAQSSMIMTTDSSTRGSFICRASGTGDSNLAGMTFWNDSYAIKLGIRADGYFGLGGWSRSAWSWYSDPSGNMVAAGNVTAYSDPRLKEEITIIDSAIEKIKQLNGVKFKWIDSSVIGNPGEYDYGILSSDVEKIAPELVVDSIHESEDGDKFKTVAYDKLVAFLIEAVKEQQKTIDVQNNRLEALEEKLKSL